MDMDGPNLFDDEVIADSEEEVDQGGLDNQSYGTFQKVSSISAFTTAGYPEHKSFSAISTFSGDAFILANQDPSLIEPSTSSKADNNQADTSIISTFLDFDGLSGTANIADRAKMRQRSQKQAVYDVIELTSEDEDELSLKPSTSKVKKPKAKTNRKAKEAKGKEVPPPNVATSTDADVVTGSKAKSRPQPRPIPKHTRYEENGASLSSNPSHVPELPLANSPARVTQIVSQLPPSDPPQPFSTAGYDEQHLPNIEILHPKSRPSSPNSLFNDLGNNGYTDMEVDELADDVEYTNKRYYDEDYISPRKMPPPATFFAGSSSSSIGGGRGDDPPIPPEPQHDVVDLTMLPPTMVPAVQKKAPKPKKQKKKLADEFYDDMNSGPVLILDEDDQDEDFDPSGDGNSKKKKKGKAKAKEKAKEKPTKGKAKAKLSEAIVSPGSGGGQVEVVITSKPPASKSKAKDGTHDEDKGKGAELVPPGNKESFKSREFIDDSDDDDPMRLIDPPPRLPSPLTTATRAGPSREGPKDIPSPPPLTIRLPVVSSTKTTVETPESDSEMKQSISSKGKGSANAKKRKTVVDSDDEDFYAEENELEVKKATSTSKKRKLDNTEKKDKAKSKKNKGKARQVILSDEEQEATHAQISIDLDLEKPIEENKSKKERSHKKIVDEEETNPFQDNSPANSPPQKFTPEDDAQATKENAAPSNSKISPALVTPRPAKAVPANRDGTTPLYARYEIAPRRSSLPMSELIRRANSMPGSPFPTPHPSSASKVKPLIARTPTSTAYSPYLKSSRNLLSKIAPLHPNRRTPPPPPPPPPPRKKSKKELEMEEKWEEEMVEEVGGMEEWAALTDAERREMRKMKWAKELGGWDE